MITSEEFKREVWKLVEETGVKPKEVHVREMKRKWGSCSTTGQLTFGKSLLKEDRALGESILAPVSWSCIE